MAISKKMRIVIYVLEMTGPCKAATAEALSYIIYDSTVRCPMKYQLHTF